MRGITLAKILETGIFKGSKILSGKDRLDRLVTGVTVGEVPDIAGWLTGGELVLSTFYAVSDDAEAVSAFAKKIIGGPAAALAVKLGRFLEALPGDVLALAKELDFPVIEVPSDTRWTSIIGDVYAAMSDSSPSASTGGDGGELLRFAIEGAGLEPIARMAAERAGLPVLIIDLVEGSVIEGGAGGSFATDLVELLKTGSLPPKTERLDGRPGEVKADQVSLSGFTVAVAHVVVGQETVAFAVIELKAANPDSLALLRKIAEATAIEISRKRAIEAAEVKLCGDFLDDILCGRLPLEQVESRAVRLGGDLSRGYTALCSSFDPDSSFGRFFREASRVIKTDSSGSLLIERDGRLIVILAQPDLADRASAVGFALLTANKLVKIGEMLGGTVRVGVGRLWNDGKGIVRALDEAKIAVDCGERLNDTGPITEFDQVGVYRLLLPLARQSREDGLSYYKETIAPLDAYDTRYKTDLVETLEAFRRNDENIVLAAEELFTHRHTVRYRLRRVSEITGLDPLKGADRERLYMGLHVKHLLGLHADAPSTA